MEAKATTNNNNNNNNNNNEKKKKITITPCCNKIGLKKGPWSREEDEVLSDFIKKEGEGRWRTLPKRAGLLRCGKSCRLRWINYLRPSLKHGHIASDEEDLILRLHRLLGNRWSLIAGRIPGRTDNEIKNYWNTHLSKKLISQGIDPRTHKPLFNSCSNSTTTPLSNHSPKLIPPTPINPIPSPHHHINIFNQDFDPNITTTTHDYLDQHQATTPNVTNDNVSEIGLIIRSNEHLLCSNNEDHCSDDDVFSSFLNSLINEDHGPSACDNDLSVPAYGNGV
ncbi:hypothetical protein Lal_00019797 [Lupinus albus]|uniref:Putative transcription factor MYB-HB-like family n=1 Tax=Lupinus albus TaxID=3870 RepID=A0A6A5PNQ4_LUPAL|nr:putative transcription factor MYB-HB-like family [Lupinus albus]KAF1899667.1 hypothetical protein Lal_00019797 [Lupinus albus]